MNSIAFICERAQASRDAQVTLAAPPASWVWGQKTVAQWDGDLDSLEQLKKDEIARRTQWRNAAELWDSDLRDIQRITRDAKREGSYFFSQDPVKQERFASLRSDGASRDDIYNQGEAASAAWQEVDAAWTYDAEIDAEDFGKLLAASLVRKKAHGAKETTWSSAVSRLANKARTVDADNVAWFAAATRKFPAGTTEGDMIRSRVPTTTRPEQEAGQAVISNVTATGGRIRFEVSAPGATRFTYLQQAPGAAAFVVVAADSPETSLTLTAQPAGLHRFKVIGSNSSGSGPESAIAEVTVSAAAAA